MGRRKFRLSDMLPNSWFHKLRDMRRAGGRSGASGVHQSSTAPSLGTKCGTEPAAASRPVSEPIPHRTSYYYASRDRALQPSPGPQATAATEERLTLVSQTRSSRVWHKQGPAANVTAPPDARHRRRDTCIVRVDGGVDVGKHKRSAVKTAPSAKEMFTGKVIASDTDIVFDLHAYDVPEKVLRPIVTKPARREEASRYEPIKERHASGHHAATTPRTSSASEQGSKGNPRRSSVSSGRRLKTRANSPRLASRCRKSSRSKTTPAAPPLAESFAIVKASADPRSDFRESMRDMIAEKGIRDARDLEDLLACYLVLNAAEHRDLIVEVFEEIWTTSLPRVK